MDKDLEDQCESLDRAGLKGKSPLVGKISTSTAGDSRPPMFDPRAASIEREEIMAEEFVPLCLAMPAG